MISNSAGVKKMGVKSIKNLTLDSSDQVEPSKTFNSDIEDQKSKFLILLIYSINNNNRNYIEKSILNLYLTFPFTLFT